MEKIRIMLAGPSGVGKTTLAETISKHLNIPFVSGSFSDAVPSTRNIQQKNMIDEATMNMEIQAVKNRLEIYKQNPSFISDRSFLDNMAYGNHKLSYRVTTCDIIDLYKFCSKLLLDYCDVLILVPYDYVYMSGSWEIKGNNKRVTNAIFQDLMTTIFRRVLDMAFSQDKAGAKSLDDGQSIYGITYGIQRNPQFDEAGEVIGKVTKVIELKPNALVFGKMPEENNWFEDLIKYIKWLRENL